MALSKQFAYGLSVFSLGLIAVGAIVGRALNPLILAALALMSSLFFAIAVPLTVRAVFGRRKRSRVERKPDSDLLEMAAMPWLLLVWVLSVGWIVFCFYGLATMHSGQIIF